MSHVPRHPPYRPQRIVPPAIAQRDYGWRSPARPAGRAGQRLTRDSVRRALQDAGFGAPQVTGISYPASAELQHAWLSIPVFTRSWLPGLPYEDRMRVLGEARQRLGPGHAEQARWVFFVARAGQPGSGGGLKCR
jgi:hypothetical protein